MNDFHSKAKNSGGFTRIALAVTALYLLITLGGSAFLAYAPEASPGRRLLSPPPCSMRVRLGIPCPLCFGTTAYILIWKGRPGAAFRLSPFVFGLFFASVAAVPFLAWLALSRQGLTRLNRVVSRRGWAVAGAVAGGFFLLNWVYLIVTLKGVSPQTLLDQL